MRKDKLDTAITEAERFLERAKALQDDSSKLRYYDKTRLETGKETGAIRRSSMDLSRALSDLRKYN